MSRSCPHPAHLASPIVVAPLRGGEGVQHDAVRYACFVVRATWPDAYLDPLQRLPQPVAFGAEGGEVFGERRNLRIGAREIRRRGLVAAAEALRDTLATAGGAVSGDGDEAHGDSCFECLLRRISRGRSPYRFERIVSNPKTAWMS